MKLPDLPQGYTNLPGDYCGEIYLDSQMRQYGRACYLAAAGVMNQILTDEEVGTLTVFEGLHMVETPLLAEYVRHIERAVLEKQRTPLTDEQIDALELPPSGTATVRDLVRIIERAHGIGVTE